MKGQSSTLPVELVRMICEFGASQSQVTAANLVCVAKVVREWIAPLLYETVILKSTGTVSRFFETIQVAKSGSNFACHVKKLYLPSAPSPGVLPSFLINFPALQHLAINSSSLRHPVQLESPSLRRSLPRPRSITITGRLGHISFMHPIFKSCTHLYLADDVPAPLSLTSDLFPCLTHLACGYRHGSCSTAAITCLTLLLPRKNLHAYARPENPSSSQPSHKPTYPVELKVLVVEMYLSNGNPDATMFVTECLGLGKKASESSLRTDPRLVLRPGITLNPERWENYVVNDNLWTSAEREIRIQRWYEMVFTS